MRNKLYVDGVDLSTFGVYISGAGTYSAPEKEYNWYDVPARNGAVLGYERRLSNIRVTYRCGIYTNFEQNISDLRNFLLSRNGLVRISDTYHPDEFRQGVYAGPFEPTITRKLDAGQFDLSFDCQPQRWLTSGETVINKTGIGNITVTNPTQFEAKPFLRVYGYGTVDFGGYYTGTRILIADYGLEYIDIDCESMNCYSGDTNLCEYVTFIENATVAGVDAPTLKPGANNINFGNTTGVTGSMVSAQLTPRWWEV